MIEMKTTVLKLHLIHHYLVGLVVANVLAEQGVLFSVRQSVLVFFIRDFSVKVTESGPVWMVCESGVVPGLWQ